MSILFRKKNIYNFLISMKIPEITQNSRQNTFIVHRGNTGIVYDKLGNVRYRCSTSFFRQDLDWLYLADFLGEKYLDIPHVNLIDYACSSGEEAYTIIISLISRLGKKQAEKFFPVIAKDLDNDNIDTAISGKYIISHGEKHIIERLIYPRVKDFVSIKVPNIQYSSSAGVFMLDANDGLKSHVEFSQADILQDIKNISEETSVVFARNMWRYLRADEQFALMEKIYEKLKGTNSLLVLGSFDSPHQVPAVYLPSGFCSNYTGIDGDHGSFVSRNLQKFNITPAKINHVYQIP